MKDLRRQLVETLGWKTPLALFPVRHHSPTGARHLEAFLRKYEPDAILIEGPAGFEKPELLADEAHQAPFALVACTGQGEGVTVRSYYPMCDYSPELVAIRIGKELGAAIEFIDLVMPRCGGGDAIESDEQLGSDDGALERSRFTAEVVKRAGCRDFDEVWEALFEQTGWTKSPEEWALELLTYAHLSRAGYTPAELEAEGTLERERFMAAQIARVTKKKKKVVVVTGAFHTAALRETDGAKAGSAGEATVFLAPYTFPRLDALLGYASGMSGPQFYQWVWEARGEEDPFGVAARRVLVETSRLARKDGEVVGTADAIQALAFGRDLAGFRGRSRVGRTELIEGATACLVKGDATLVGQRLHRALAEVMRGTKVGKLGPSAGEPPLVRDFRARMEELRLPVEHGRPVAQELAVFQSDLALRRSRFFQQCRFLNIPFAEHQRGPNLATGEDLHLTIEHWAVQWVPEIEARLLELAHLGATVEDVASATLASACGEDGGKAGPLAMHVLRGLVMGLHRTTARLVPHLGAAMFQDDDALSLLEAGSRLRSVLRGRERLEGASVQGLPDLARQAFLQGALRLERLATLGPDRAEQVVGALSTLLEVATTEKELAPPREMLVNHAREGAERTHVPFLQGALHGLLLQLRELPIETMAKTLGRLSRGKTRTDGLGAYLEGVLALARQALLGESALLEAFLVHVRESAWEDFLASLPALRRAFTRLTPRETESVATAAAERLGMKKSDLTGMLGASPEVVARLSSWEQAAVAAEMSWGGP